MFDEGYQERKKARACVRVGGGGTPELEHSPGLS